MADFKTPLEVRMLPEMDDQHWQLISPLVYQSDLVGEIVVPTGFITNFASFAPLKYAAIREAVIHDYLYNKKNVSRKMADQVFLEAMHSTGNEEAETHLMYLGVRLGGGSHYRED